MVEPSLISDAERYRRARLLHDPDRMYAMRTNGVSAYLGLDRMIVRWRR